MIVEVVLSRGQAKRGGEAFGNAEECDRHAASAWGTGIASQPLRERQTCMCTLGPGERWRRGVWSHWESRLKLDLDPLTAHLKTGPAVLPPIPVPPEQRSRANPERMEQNTHLTWLYGSAAVPLTVFAQRTGTATADAGCIDHTQASIRFPAPLLGDQGLLCGAAQRPVRLEGKVRSPEATCFPGGTHLRGSIAGGRSGGC